MVDNLVVFSHSTLVKERVINTRTLLLMGAPPTLTNVSSGNLIGREVERC